MTEKMEPALTFEQIQHFRHSGYLKLGILPSQRVDQLKQAIWKDIEDEVEPVVRDKAGDVVRISNLVDRDPIFLETISSDQVVSPLVCVLGPNIHLIKNRHNHATLRTSSQTYDSLHRDVRQWSRTIFTIIFYLEETTIENGCTWLVPGSHHFPGIDGKVGEDPWTTTVSEQAVPLPMPVGGMVLIDSMVMHRAGNNTTDHTRISMTLGFHSVDELSDVRDPKRILIHGEESYSGNDKKK
jgi:ectoine hydroxylase-related dioxygenase (phytanoyl-CoA dioxygenase family)